MAINTHVASYMFFRFICLFLHLSHLVFYSDCMLYDIFNFLACSEMFLSVYGSCPLGKRFLFTLLLFFALFFAIVLC